MADAQKEKQAKIFKKRLLSVIGNDRDLLAMADVKLLTANRNSQTWLYSDLKGSLCFVLDHTIGARYLILFDSRSLIRLFNMELYKNFDKNYTKLTDNFQCFEISGGSFIGFKFEDIQEAKSFFIIVKKFDDSLTTMQLEGQNFKKKQNDKKIIFNKYCEIIKKKSEEQFVNLKKFGEDYIEDGMEIHMPKNLNIVNFLMYDKDKKAFHVEKTAPKFVRNMFKNVGLKKSDLKHASIMLYFIKRIIEEYQKFDLVKASNDCNIDDQDQYLSVRNLVQNIIKTNTGENKYIPRNRVENKSIVPIKPKVNASDMDLISINPKLIENANLIKKDNTQDFRKTVVVPDSSQHQNKIENNTKVPQIPSVPKIPTVPSTVPKIPVKTDNKTGIPNIPVVPSVGIPQIPKNLPKPNQTSNTSKPTNKSTNITNNSNTSSMSTNLSIEDELKVFKFKKAEIKQIEKEQKPTETVSSNPMFAQMMSMKLKKVEDNKFPIPTTNKTSNPIITNTSTTNNTSTSTKIPVPIPNINQNKPVSQTPNVPVIPVNTINQNTEKVNTIQQHNIVDNNTNNTSQSSGGNQISLNDLQGMKLKKVESEKPKIEVKKFESSLKAELDFRRKKLNENNNNSGDEDDRWSDSD